MRKSFVIIFFLFTINFHSFSQAGFYGHGENLNYMIIDSIKKLLPVSKDSQRIDCLNNLSDSYLTFNTYNIFIARSYAKQALEESIKINYIKGRAQAYLNMGRIECNLITDLPSAEKYFSNALTLYIEIGNQQEIAYTWAALGYAKWVLSKFPESMEAFEKAEQLFSKIKDTVDLLENYSNMFIASLEWGHYSKSLEIIFKEQEFTGEEDSDKLGLLYSTIGDEETAAQYRRVAFPDRNKTSVNRDTTWRYLYTAGSFSQRSQYDSALHYYRLFSGFAQKVGAGPQIKLYDGLGEVYLGMKQYDSALLYVNRSLKLSKKGNDRNQVMRGLLILSKVYKGKNDYKSAIQTAQELLQLAKQTGARQFALNASFLIYQFFDHLKNQGRAYSYLQQYMLLKDSVDLDKTAQKLAFYRMETEREQAQSRINILDGEKKLQQQKIKQSAQQKIFLFIGIICVSILGFIIVRNVSLKRKNEKHLREIAENELQMQKLETQKQFSELEMQALRSQMNPHFIFNCLSSINRFILKNKTEEASDYLTKFSRLIRMVLNNSKQSFISLEDELETLRLYLEMERLRFKNSFDYSFDFKNSVDIDNIFIPPLLLQPFAENAIWHGLMHKQEKGFLNFDFSAEEKFLTCIITDNGVGREQAELLKSKSVEKQKSMGLKITTERLSLLNNNSNEQTFFIIEDLTDENENALGTRVHLKIFYKEMMEV